MCGQFQRGPAPRSREEDISLFFFELKEDISHEWKEKRGKFEITKINFMPLAVVNFMGSVTHRPNHGGFILNYISPRSTPLIMNTMGSNS